MKTLHSLLVAMYATTFCTLAADSPKDELVAAAKALAARPNYSWKTTVQVPEDTQFKPGPTDGMANKDGLILVSQSFGPGTMKIVKQGDKAAMTNQDGGWDSLAEAEQAEGFGRFRAVMARNLMAPAEDVIDLTEHMKEIKKNDDVFSGDLTEEGAKSMMGMGGRRRGGGNAPGPNIPEASGSARFWVTDGVLSKMEIKVVGYMEFNGNEVDIIRSTTTEILDVGSTKIEVPEAAQEKMK